jgi:hypothetical protein
MSVDTHDAGSVSGACWGTAPWALGVLHRSPHAAAFDTIQVVICGAVCVPTVYLVFLLGLIGEQTGFRLLGKPIWEAPLS